MRCTQTIGLTYAARTFLNKNVQKEVEVVCPCCGHKRGGCSIERVYDTKTGREKGMFDDGPDLMEYTLKDGSKVREIVQISPWSSGPMIFLCLEDESGKHLFKWKEDKTLLARNLEVDEDAGTYYV